MKKYISLSITLLIVFVLGLYWKVFHDGLSNNSTDWGNFGGYFNGVLTPILTIINIFVFVSISMKISMLDDKRADRESQGQKDLMLMQFRKIEIDNFEKVMDEALVPSLQLAISKEALARPIILADMYLQTFLKSKLSLFNLSEENEVTQSILKLKNEINCYHKKFIGNEILDGNDIVNLLELKSIIVRGLQTITIKSTKVKYGKS